jgi:hypothetical protein
MAALCVSRRTNNNYYHGIQRVHVPGALQAINHHREYPTHLFYHANTAQEHIIGEIYTGTQRRTKQARRKKRDELDKELRAWKQGLQSHLCFDPRQPVHIPTPMIFSLQ